MSGHAHRTLWEKEYGPIPLGYVIHHKNGDGFDNCLENLEMLPWGEHSRLHVKGKKQSPEHVAKRAESMRKNWKGKTHCLRGHVLTEDNVYVRKNNPHQRACRTCQREGNVARRLAETLDRATLDMVYWK